MTGAFIDVAGSALMFCEAGMNFADYVTGYRFVEAVTCFIAGETGIAAFAMVLYGAVAVPLYITQDSAMVPLVLLFLTGGATMATIAAPGLSLGTIVLLVSAPAVVTLLYYRYGR